MAERTGRFWGNAPLRRKLIIAFSIAVVSTFVFLWIFDILLFDIVYESIKVDKLKKSAALIANNIDNPDLDVLLKHIAYQDETCISVFDREGNEWYSQPVRTDCTIHNISVDTKLAYFDKVSSSGGYKEEIKVDAFNDNYGEANFDGKLPQNEKAGIKAVIYVKSVESGSEELLIVTEGVVTPLVSEKNTWVAMLAIATGALLIAAIVLAIVIAHNVTKPIAKLTEGAREIAKGNVDITISGEGFKEINELKKGLEYAAGEVTELEHYRRELIANVSHDLRTPLTLIKGYTEMMRDIPDEATPENFQVVIDESSRLTGLVNDMLDLSKEQESSGGLKLKRFDVVGVLNELIARHAKLVEHLGYKIIYEHEDSAVVYADESKLVQVIYNLINNAVNYAGEDMTVTVKEYTRANNVRIEVIDKGEGIDVSVLPHIWDRYYKSEKSHKRATVGTGLGLSIVKSVMNKHPGGVYGVVTSVGEGSTFYVELPKY